MHFKRNISLLLLFISLSLATIYVAASSSSQEAREKRSLAAEGCAKAKGDANCDGRVDGVDYSLWLNTQCQPAAGQSCADLKADFNGDGKVNDDDYQIWFANRGTVIVPPTNTPPPASGGGGGGGGRQGCQVTGCRTPGECCAASGDCVPCREEREPGDRNPPPPPPPPGGNNPIRGVDEYGSGFDVPGGDAQDKPSGRNEYGSGF